MCRLFRAIAPGVLWMFAGFSVMAQEAGFRLEGIGSLEIPVTMGKMTNLVFPVDVLTGIKVSKGILAQKVKGVENVIEIKANRRDVAATNLSVYGKNGRLYSFVLRYTEDSSVLNFRVVDGNGFRAVDEHVTGKLMVAGDHPIHLTGLPTDLITLAGDSRRIAAKKGFLHLSKKRERMRIALEGIYLRNSLEWMKFRLTNGSLIDYHPSFLRFYSEDREKIKRRAVQQLGVSPLYGDTPPSVGGEKENSFAVGFVPFALASGKRLVVEMAEPDGGRVLVLHVKSKILLKARRG